MPGSRPLQRFCTSRAFCELRGFHWHTGAVACALLNAAKEERCSREPRYQQAAVSRRCGDGARMAASVLTGRRSHERWCAAALASGRGAEVLGIPAVAVAEHLSFSASRLVRALTGAPPSRPANRFCATEQAPASPSLPCSVRCVCLLGIPSGCCSRIELRGQKCSPRPSNLSALLRAPFVFAPVINARGLRRCLPAGQLSPRGRVLARLPARAVFRSRLADVQGAARFCPLQTNFVLGDFNSTPFTTNGGLGAVRCPGWPLHCLAGFGAAVGIQPKQCAPLLILTRARVPNIRSLMIGCGLPETQFKRRKSAIFSTVTRS